jgi:hypothetical protein
LSWLTFTASVSTVPAATPVICVDAGAVRARGHVSGGAGRRIGDRPGAQRHAAAHGHPAGRAQGDALFGVRQRLRADCDAIRQA